MDSRFHERCQKVLVLDPPQLTQQELRNSLTLSQTLLRHTLLEIDRLHDKHDQLLEQNQKLASQLARSAQYLQRVLATGGAGGRGESRFE